MADKIIQLKNVTYSYPLTKKPALQEISLEIEKGKLYGIVGSNGSGKTTLCITICGYATTFEKGEMTGEVLIKGKKLEDYEEGEVSRMTGYVLQNPFSQISGVRNTVFEEIAYGLENLGVDPEEMEDRVVGIAQKTNIEHLLLKNPYELSGGQQQRVALASVLVLDPEILVIDEPTSQLDPDGTESIFKVIETLKAEGKTILLVEHKMDLLAEYADAIIVLEEGRCIAAGITKDILGDAEMEKHGVQLPQMSSIFNKLKTAGIDFGTIPITYDEALMLLRRRKEGVS